MEKLAMPKNLLPEGGEAYFYPAFFSPEESDAYFRALAEEVSWRQEPIKVFGREILQPRLTSWFADPGIAYGYSGIKLRGSGWSPLVQRIKEKIEPAVGVTFNGALLNYYRSGADSMGWHRDNEKELGTNPVIASVSFGAGRRFLMRLKAEPKVSRELILGGGSLLIMGGEMQHAWEHSVPKTAKDPGARINLTFRVLP